MTECYVCYEPCIEPTPCLCKTLYIHDSCLTILRMYGNTQCGVCKTQFDNSVPVDQVLDIPPSPPSPPASPEPLDVPDLKRPPCICYLICVKFRCGKYLVTETDLACDSLRMMLFLFTVFICISIYSESLIPDFFLYVTVTMFALGCYNALLSRRQTRRRMLNRT